MHRFTYRIALAALIVTPPVFLALSAKQERHQHEECLQTLRRIDSIKEQSMACHALVREIDAAKEQIGMDGWMTLGYQTRHGTMDDSPICEGTIAPWRRNAQTGKHQRVHPR